MEQEVKNKVESVLFSSGKAVEEEEIRKLCRIRDENEVRQALKELKEDYEKRDSALIVIDDKTKWKLTVRESYMNVAKRIIADTELSKTIIETLAVIAWKQPITQAEVIKIRTNKAYDHVHELEELGFLTRKKHGRTRMIKLTEKFFKYFELSGNKDIKEVFKSVKDEEPADQKKMEEFVDEEEKVGQLEVYEEKKAKRKKQKSQVKRKKKQMKLKKVTRLLKKSQVKKQLKNNQRKKMLLLKCPKCKNKMKYQPAKAGKLSDKTKQCVYCGRAFKVSLNIVRKV